MKRIMSASATRKAGMALVLVLAAAAFLRTAPAAGGSGAAGTRLERRIVELWHGLVVEKADSWWQVPWEQVG